MVLGMRYGSSFNYAMAGLYRAAVAVSALVIFASAAHAADPPVPRSNVLVNLNPTTNYYTATNSTLRLPNGVSTAPASGVPVVSRYPAGLQQTIPTGVTIDAIKKSAPLPVVVRANTQSVKNAAKRFLGSPKANLAFLAASAGLQQLLDGIDWVMTDGSAVRKKSTSYADGAPDDYVNSVSTTTWFHESCPPAGSPFVTSSGRNEVSTGKCNSLNGGRYNVWSCPAVRGSTSLNGFDTSTCYYGDAPASDYVTVSDSEISSTVDSAYSPDPSDWRSLTPHLDLDDVEITSAPTLQGEPKTTTVYDAEGNPHKVTQTNIWFDFDVRDNPSPRPALDLKTREEIKTYEDGVLTGTTTTESASSAGSGDAPPPESLIDCELFPTACAWFDWTQEEPVEPDDDLSGLLQEVPIVSETFTITGGVAACPAPMVLDLSVFGSREVSYQPLCDLASTMKYLYLALMSFAAAVLLNRSVNRV